MTATTTPGQDLEKRTPRERPIARRQLEER